MSDSVATFAAVPSAIAPQIGEFVRLLKAGSIKTRTATLKLDLPFRFEVTDIAGGVRLAVLKNVEIDRPGLNVWLDHFDLFETGRIEVQVHRMGVTLVEEVKP